MTQDIETDPAPQSEAAASQAAAAPTRPRSIKGMLAIGTLALAGGLVAWSSGNSETRWSTDPARSAVAAPATAPRHAVAAAPAVPAPAAMTDEIRGVIQSRSEAVISSRITARVTAMPYRSGDSFGRGALLASFDCGNTRAQLSAANAAARAYRKTYDTNVELDAFKAVGTNEVEISQANFNKATAEANAISSQLGDCAIYAPFSGRVVEQMGHAHEVAASGQPLMKIQDSNDLEVQIMVPSNWLTRLKPGTPFSFKVDETGAVFEARVRRLGASVDPVSKTLRVIGGLNREGQTVLPGMSGTAKFDASMVNDGKQG
jgi:RND family efflux transporter MFP subunit